MKQVIVIHGGDSFRNRAEYLHALKRWPVSLNSFLPHADWKANLPQALGKKYQVLLPKMPNKNNARYEEWKIWFERLVPLLQQHVILIGHSLGGMFLAKYLSQRQFPKRIRALILIAAADNGTADIDDFRLPKSLEPVKTQCQSIHLFHSPNDPVVPLLAVKTYHHLLPTAQVHILQNRGHFNQPQFPELVRLIKALSTNKKNF